MAYYFTRLTAPRPTFAHDMTEAEAAVMDGHAGYWSGLLARGSAMLFGPVLDPQGAWGLGILRADNEGEARQIMEADPILGADLGFSYELHPMPRTHLRGPDAASTVRR